MADLQTNLNASPYFDDYDVEKGFHRILFRPATAVQARELTQIQTMLQRQIEHHGNFTFKDGSVVDGCSINYFPGQPYVHLDDFFDSNTALTATDVFGYGNTTPNVIVTNGTDSNTALRAVPVLAKNGFAGSYPNTNRLYLNYINTGTDASNNDVVEFSSGETLYVYENTSMLADLDANNIVDSISVITANATANATGNSYVVSVGDGTIFQKGFFVDVDPQFITVKDFDENPNTYVVGFETKETITTPEQDITLYDNALGYPNYNAPGAHRLTLTPTLVAKTRADTSNTNFFPIVEFFDRTPTQQNTGEEGLNKMLDIVAKRYDDAHGDYVTKPFKIEALDYEANNELVSYNISAGGMYVNGYDVQLLNSHTIQGRRGTDVREVEAKTFSTNFGNYVIVDEAAGLFNDGSFPEIELRDTAQQAITNGTGSDGSASGSIIGYANVRGFEHYVGTKGQSDCQYRVYLFNVRMNTGQSFSDVRSITTSSAEADIVLTNNRAEIKEPFLNSLVFPSGYKAVKRLRSSAGDNDNQFIFDDTQTGVLVAANGFATFTIASAGAGGAEALIGSGVQTASQEEKYNFILETAAYTANLSGTVDASATNVIIGTSTTFTSDFDEGDLIRFQSGTVAKVDAVANDTSMTINTTTTVSSNTYSKYYPDGHIIDLNVTGGSLNVTSNSQFSVQTGLTLEAGDLASGNNTLSVQYPVLRSSATEKAKEINKTQYVKIDTANNSGGTTGPWCLGFADVHKIRAVYHDDGANTYSTDNTDRIDWFELDDGQRDSMYELATLSVKPQYANKITSGDLLLVELDYFTSNTTLGLGFFSVDSYPIDDANTANTTAIQTAEIPRFYSDTLDTYINLRDAVDFRPRRVNTASIAASEAAATINPPTSNTSAFADTGDYLVNPSEVFQSDLEYYLKRVDMLVMAQNGAVSIKEGIPDDDPVEPRPSKDVAVIARADVPAYPSLTPRESDELGLKGAEEVKTSIRTNRGYNMRDIGVIDQRLKQVEYYTALSLLEKRTKDIIVPDAAGNDRFKNGIFADNFQSHLIGKVSDPEYVISIDKDKGIARPTYKSHVDELDWASTESNDVQQTGHILTLPYSTTTYINQRFATKVRNCAESVWKWNGSLRLFPNYDFFRDETRSPAVNIDLDLTSPWREFANSPFGSNFGDWRVTSRTSRVNVDGRTTTTTTTTNSERLIQSLNVDTTTEDFNVGDFVTDVSISPYIRSQRIAFTASGLKPNTVMHFFFDGENVDQYVYPGETNLSEADALATVPSDRVSITGAAGSEMRSDSSGNLVGVFVIPEGTFRTGDRDFFICDQSDLVIGEDAILTNAKAEFTADNLSVTKQQTTLTTRNPILTTTTTRDTRSVTSSTTITRPAPQPRGIGGDNDRGSPNPNERGDPIAQTFMVEPSSLDTGVTVSQIGLFFKTKDETLGIEVHLMETTSGYPDKSRTVAVARRESNEITVSEDASAETIFLFDVPVYLSPSKQYAFMVMPDGNSPEYDIWVSETGDRDISTGEQVSSNPYVGVLFVSANAFTWTANQTEDIKFNLYRAQFTANAGYAVFNSQNTEMITITGLTPYSNNEFSIAPGDVVVAYDTSANTIVTDVANAQYGYGVVDRFDFADDYLQLKSSSGTWVGGRTIQIHRPNNGSSVTSMSNTTLVADATIDSISDQDYHAIVPKFAYIEPQSSSLTVSHKGRNTAGTQDSAYGAVTNDYEKEFTDYSRRFFSSSNTTESNKFKLDLVGNAYVSPFVDLRRKSGLMVENIINNDSTDEHTKYGSAKARYVSKNVVLDDRLGNAEDLKVFLTAYRPAEATIEVYFKAQGSDDQDRYTDRLWTKMEETLVPTPTSSPSDPTDFVELEFNVPSSVLHTVGSSTTAFLNALNDDIIEYDRNDGSTIIGFNTFNFKIVLLSSDGISVPRVKDIRAMALQK